LQKNTDDGLHTANLGGSWLTIISGFAGLEVNNNQLVLENRLPDEWEKLVFRLKFQNRLIKVTFTHGSSDVSLLQGKPIKIIVNDIEEKLGLKKIRS
jgi:Trehalose and maltose hydrolases (possible phosphorylases)